MTPEEAAKVLRQVGRAYARAADTAEVASLNAVRGPFIRRIHNQGKKADGSSIGQYKDGYHKRQRAKRRRQVQYVDLTDKRDLIRSYRVGRAERRNVLGFINDRERLKAQGNQDRYGEIFKLSKSEYIFMVKTYIRVLNQQATKILQNVQ